MHRGGMELLVPVQLKVLETAAASISEAKEVRDKTPANAEKS